jgi:hypothetical protein
LLKAPGKRGGSSCRSGRQTLLPSIPHFFPAESKLTVTGGRVTVTNKKHPNEIRADL